ncbi:MAG: 3-oxoacyl-[acyl-carrier-protein] synthase [Cryptosporangiaceae bacterium]|jgi:3-oxoacyl-(acyl-carrier-protein) synthase|nr:3-oxoacyl-[acyl-carrier-protein] synthase [Cryptosporangiaceae bacterium]
MGTDPPRIALTGLSVLTAYGRGMGALADGVYSGDPAFGPVTRFPVSRYRVGVAAALPGDPVLEDELVGAVGEACGEAGLTDTDRAATPLLLARHADPAVARLPEPGLATAADTGVAVARRSGLLRAERTYNPACVAASNAVATAAAMIGAGRAERVVVAAGYLVDADNFALFDAGRALAADGQLRSFSAGRKGLLLGDGVGAVVVESLASAERRGAPVLAHLAGWGRAGDAYHVCQPHPEGIGMARAMASAARRAGVPLTSVGYVNAHGTGTRYNDSAEAAAVNRAFGEHAENVPVSSTKSLHGHTLEASGLVELAVTVLALQRGKLPVNAGYLGPDEQCRLNLVTGEPLDAQPEYAMSLNAAFGGANTALLVRAA